MKPLIGILVCEITAEKQAVSTPYIQAIQNCGGCPLLIPLTLAPQTLQSYVAFFDGFLFCGGGDITPVLFGEEPLFSKGASHLAFDLFQLRLIRSVLQTPKPILAICRGMQILNVSLGGTLYQDLSLFPTKTLQHMQSSVCRQDISHKVSILPNTLLSQIMGKSVYTNSFHHQAVKALGKGLIPSAHTCDHITEGIELADAPFVLGVQWHPECMLPDSHAMEKLFHCFLDHCKTNLVTSAQNSQSYPTHKSP